MKIARFCRVSVPVALAALVAAPIAAAQSVQPPKVEALDSGGTILAYLVGLVLAAAAVGLAAMPSRREHQD